MAPMASANALMANTYDNRPLVYRKHAYLWPASLLQNATQPAVVKRLAGNDLHGSSWHTMTLSALSFVWLGETGILTPQGPTCSEQWMYAGDNQVNCFSSCSNAGICKSGWCHCEPGRWGIDCSRTKASTHKLQQMGVCQTSVASVYSHCTAPAWSL